MSVDYIVVGQGICGTFLSWNLVNAGKTVLVIDEPRPFSSSKVASGVINPVTGRRIVKTWMIDELLPFVRQQYGMLGDELGRQVIRRCDIVQFHATPQMKEAFEQRYNEEPQYLQHTDEGYWKTYFNFNYGAGSIAPCLLVDMHAMLDGWRAKLQGINALREERFDATQLAVEGDSVCYGDISAKKIIFCTGTDSFSLPYFSLLPHASNKGEAIIAEIRGLPGTHIFKQAYSIVPWRHGLSWIGSTYEWTYKDLLPSPRFRERVEAQLTHWLRLPYTIVDHIASERPATLERRPFVGLHPHQPAIGIFNGMGTKGCSLAPYFAVQFTRHLLYNEPIAPEADVQRFRRVLLCDSG